MRWGGSDRGGAAATLGPRGAALAVARRRQCGAERGERGGVGGGRRRDKAGLGETPMESGGVGAKRPLGELRAGRRLGGASWPEHPRSDEAPRGASEPGYRCPPAGNAAPAAGGGSRAERRGAGRGPGVRGFPLLRSLPSLCVVLFPSPMASSHQDTC